MLTLYVGANSICIRKVLISHKSWGSTAMCDQRNQDSPHGAVNARRLVSGAPASNRKKRRHFLKSSALLITGAIGAGLLPAKGLAQIAGAANADLELARLRGQRRILLRGGVVLTLDRQIGDFT